MSRASRRTIPRLWLRSGIAVIGLAVGGVIAAVLPGYLLYIATTAIVASIALIGLGVVTGTAGMIALCQLSFAAIGAWVVSWLNLIHAPGGYIVWLLLGCVASAASGLLLGIPALRLRGINLAVITLGFAAALDLTLVKLQFPGADQGTKIQRPWPFDDDRGFFLFAVIALVVAAVVVSIVQAGRWGSAWRSVAFSERGTATAGASVRFAKLSAFAVSAAISGLAGGLLAGQVGMAFPTSFAALQSLALYLLSIVVGAHLIEMAIFGGILWVLIPEIFKRFGISQDWGLVLFGVLGIQAITSKTSPGQLLRNAIARRRPTPECTSSLTDAPPQPPDTAGTPAVGAALLEVSALSVTYGELKALDHVGFTIHENEIVGLIGPNGAGKSTLVDAISGFVPLQSGDVRLQGRSLRRSAPHVRARAGLRRTYQQDRVPPTLTVGAFTKFVGGGASTPHEIDEILDFFGCPDAGTPLASVDVGRRRIVEVAAQLSAKPNIPLLDEPAAGLSHEEHEGLALRLVQVPARFGASVLLIEHDLNLVRSVCTSLLVLDFGTLLASGPQEQVLSRPEVKKAYMGETEML